MIELKTLPRAAVDATALVSTPHLMANGLGNRLSPGPGHIPFINLHAHSAEHVRPCALSNVLCFFKSRCRTSACTSHGGGLVTSRFLFSHPALSPISAGRRPESARLDEEGRRARTEPQSDFTPPPDVARHPPEQSGGTDLQVARELTVSPPALDSSVTLA